MLDTTRLNLLRWRCRRGMLENDLLIERFFERYGSAMTESQARGLHALMDLPDNDLLDLLLARKQPEGKLAASDVYDVLTLIRDPHYRLLDGSTHHTRNTHGAI